MHAQAFGPLLDSEIPFNSADPERPTVLERARPEIAPLGISTGPFLVFPQMTTMAGFTNNAFGSRTNKRSDAFIELNPTIEARSRWSRHMLNVHAEGALRRYLRTGLRDEDTYDTFAEGRLDFAGQSTLYAQVRAVRSYLEQYSGDVPDDATASVPLDRKIAVLRGTYVFNRVSLIANADIRRMDFSDVVSRGGADIDQDFRDETVWRFSARGEYRLGPARAAFVQVTRAQHQYRKRQPGEIDRDGDEIRAQAGLAFYPSPVLRLRASAGYMWRRYEDRTISDLSSPLIDIQADYLVTGLTTFSLAATRVARDSFSSRSPGFITTTVRARGDHELLRNLLLHVQGDFLHERYVAIDRKDDAWRIEAGATYTPYRRIVIEPTAQFVRRSSAGLMAGKQFSELRFLLKTTFRP